MIRKRFSLYFLIIILLFDQESNARPGGGQTYRSSSSSSSSRSSSSSNRSSSSSYRSNSSSTTSKPYSYTPPKSYSSTTTRPNSNRSYKENSDSADAYLVRYKAILTPETFPQKMKKYSLAMEIKKDTGLFIKETIGLTIAEKSKNQFVRHLLPFRWGNTTAYQPVSYLNFQSGESIQKIDESDFSFEGNFYEPSKEYRFETPQQEDKLVWFEYSAYKKNLFEKLSDEKVPTREKSIHYRWPLLPVNANDYDGISGGDFEIRVPTENFSYKIDGKDFSIIHNKTAEGIKGKILARKKSKSSKIPEILITIPYEALDESLTPISIFTQSDYISRRSIKISYKTDGSSFVEEKIYHKNLDIPEKPVLAFNYFNPIFEGENFKNELFHYEMTGPAELDKMHFSKSMYVQMDHPEINSEAEYSLKYKTFGSCNETPAGRLIRFGIPHHPFGKYQGPVELDVIFPNEWKIQESAISVWNGMFTYSSSYSEPLIYSSSKEKIRFLYSDGNLKVKVPRIDEMYTIIFDVRLSTDSVIQPFPYSSKLRLALGRAYNVHAFNVLFTLFFAFVIGLTIFLIRRNKKRSMIQAERARILQSEADSKRAQEENERAEKDIKEKLSDPEFNASGFLKRVRNTGIQLTTDWLSGDLSRSRSSVSSGIYNRFRVQLSLLKKEGLVNVMADWEIHPLKIQSVDQDNGFHVLHVLIQGRAKDMNLPMSMSDEERKRKVSAQQKIGYKEYWSFVRRVNAKTKIGILSGHCPNCGGIVENISQSNKCANCGTIYNSSEYDWVLSEITQADEWGKQTSHANIPGLESAAKILPFISKQIIEDRASAIFWRWIDAMVSGSKNPLIRDATSVYISAAKFDKKYFSQPAVGLVELKKVTEEKDFLESEIEIFWSASLKPNEGPQNIKTVITLILKRATKNNFGIAEHSCPYCGGSLPEDDSLKCAYCSSALPSKNQDWLLQKIS